MKPKIDHQKTYTWRVDGSLEVTDTSGEGTQLRHIRRLEKLNW